MEFLCNQWWEAHAGALGCLSCICLWKGIVAACCYIESSSWAHQQNNYDCQLGNCHAFRQQSLSREKR